MSVSIGQQSNDIAGGVFNSLEAREGRQEDDYDLQGAGDQGIMFGYASDETASYMPTPIWLAHRLSERLTEVRKNGELAYLRPDGKTQVTVGTTATGRFRWKLWSSPVSTQKKRALSSFVQTLPAT